MSAPDTAKPYAEPKNFDDTKQYLKEDEYVIGALIFLYGFQTGLEKNVRGTVEQNNSGFNSFDASILSSMAEYYLNKKYLTKNQLLFVRTKMLKYHRQLTDGWKPLPTGMRNSSSVSKSKEKRIVKMEVEILEKKTLIIQFQFPRNDDRFKETLEFIKTLPQRKWNPAPERYWTANLNLKAVESLYNYGFKFGPDLEEWRNKHKTPGQVKPINPDGIKGQLYEFQKEGIGWIEAMNGRAIIGDEMGLGKTVQALGWLQLHPELRPTVIVPPASLKSVWLKECFKWMSDDIVKNVIVLNGFPALIKNPAEYIKEDNIVIVNYDILTNKYGRKPNGKYDFSKVKTFGWGHFLKKLKPQVLVMDEFHHIKSNGALRTRAMKILCKKIPHIIGLSGTPIINRPIEFYNVLNIIKPELFSGWFEFTQRYCDPQHNGYGWDHSGSSHTKELHQILTKHVMIRRKKDQVLKELPPKRRVVITLPIDNRAEYRRAENDIIGYLLETKGEEAAEKASNAEHLVRFEKLKQIAVSGKLKMAKEWISDFIEEEKLILFVEHHFVSKAIKKAFRDGAVLFTGQEDDDEKDEAVERFQNDPDCKLFIGSKAAKEGLTLTAASNTAFLELWWSPGHHQQAEDRPHRIGQEAESVTAYYLIAEDTIEEEIAELIDSKAKVLSAILDGEDVKVTSLLTELTAKYKKRRAA